MSSETPKTVEQEFAELALTGMMQAANDAIGDLLECSLPRLREINRDMQAAALPSLSALVDDHTRRLDAILNCGKLRSESEYYLVNEVLTDTTRRLGAAERSRMEHLVGSFHGG